MRFLTSAMMLVSALPHAMSETECTSPGVDAIKASGDSLLQTQRHKQVAFAAANAAPAKAMACAQATQCKPVRPHGLLGRYQVARRHNAAKELSDAATSLLSIGEGVDGASAPLDAFGFKAVSSLCCPPEMEVFFIRLLEARGYKVCSMPHLQGLMHWFSCVPDMDFQYVIDVILNGNPCKYWAPSGETCPALSAQCAGTYCGSSGASPAAAPAPAPATPTPAPATPAPTTTAAPAEETTTTEPGPKVDPGTCPTTAECECLTGADGGHFNYAMSYTAGYNKRCIAAYRLGTSFSSNGKIEECGAVCDAEATCTSFDLQGIGASCQLCKAGAESANLEDTTMMYGTQGRWLHYVYAPNLCAAR